MNNIFSKLAPPYEGSADLSVVQVEDEGIQHGCEDGVEDRHHLILGRGQARCGFGIYEHHCSIINSHMRWEEQVAKTLW